MKKYLLSLTVLLVATQSFAHMSVGDSVSYQFASDNHIETKTVVSINPESGSMEVSFDDGRGTSGLKTDQSLARLNSNEVALSTCAPINAFQKPGKKLISYKVEAGQEFFDVCYYDEFIEKVNGKEVNARVEQYFSADAPWLLIRTDITRHGVTETMELNKFNKAKE